MTTLAYNCAPLADYSGERPFLDLVKSMRQWIGTGSSFQTMDNAAVVAAGVLDANGWPTSIPSANGTSALRGIWATDAVGGRAWEPDVNYVMTWSGSTTPSLSGSNATVTIHSTGDHRKVFSVSPTGSAALLLLDLSGPSAGVSIVPERYEELAVLGQKFNPDWLAIVQDARLLRFMDWMKINSSTQVNWSDRPTAGDYSFTWRGPPIEWMVELCNQIGADWMGCIPHLAVQAGGKNGTGSNYDAGQTFDGDYVTSLCTYLKANLDPALKAFLEYSNETWNFALGTQAGWINQQGVDWWSTDQNGSFPFNYYKAKLATMAASDAAAVFSGADRSRLVNVMGIQTAENNAFVLPRQLDARGWKAQTLLDPGAAGYDPDPWIDPATVIDAVAVTTYFGNSTVQDATLSAQMVSQIAALGTDGAMAWLRDKLKSDGSYNQSIPKIIGQWNTVRAVCDTYGVDMIAYEGGQHVAHSAYSGSLSSGDAATLSTFIAAFVASDYMVELYQELWNQWKLVSDGPFMQYFDLGAQGGAGAWGSYIDLNTPTSRGVKLNQLNASEVPWWDAPPKPAPKTSAVIPDLGGVVSMSERGGVLVNGSGHGVARLPAGDTVDDFDAARDGDDPNLYVLTHKVSGIEHRLYACQVAAIPAT